MPMITMTTRSSISVKPSSRSSRCRNLDMQFSFESWTSTYELSRTAERSSPPVWGISPAPSARSSDLVGCGPDHPNRGGGMSVNGDIVYKMATAAQLAAAPDGAAWTVSRDGEAIVHVTFRHEGGGIVVNADVV